MLNRIAHGDRTRAATDGPGQRPWHLLLASGVLFGMTTGGALATSSLAPSATGEAARYQATPGAATPVANVVDDCWSEPAADVPYTGDEGEEGTMAQYAAAPAMKIDPEKRYVAKLETNKGDIEVEFFPKEAPQTVNNFVCLADDGYYDNTPFHRIVKGFVIQGGDPTGTGAGGPGYQFNDEKVTRAYSKGILAMANAGPNTNGSQFFIVLDNVGLPPAYTIFGQVISGQDVVDAIAMTPTKVGRSGENSAPTETITLERVTISQE